MTRGAGSRAGDPELSQQLRALPSVEQLASSLVDLPHADAVAGARAAIDAGREALRAGGDAFGVTPCSGAGYGK